MVLAFMWYCNIVLTALIVGFMSVCYCTSETTRMDIPVVAVKKQSVTIQSSSLSYPSVTLGTSQDMLTIELKNTFGHIALSVLFLAAMEILAMTIIYQLRKFFQSISEQQPFNYLNVRRLKITALCCVLCTVLHILFGLTTHFIIEQSVKDYSDIRIVWSESFIGVALGAAIYVMADVFRYGLSLQKENEEFV